MSLLQKVLSRGFCHNSIILGYFQKDSETPAKMLNCSQAGSYVATAPPVTVGSTVSIRVENPVNAVHDNMPETIRSSAIAEVECFEKQNNQHGVGARYYL